MLNMHKIIQYPNFKYELSVGSYKRDSTQRIRKLKQG